MDITLNHKFVGIGMSHACHICAAWRDRDRTAWALEACTIRLRPKDYAVINSEHVLVRA
jgi:hypothetical protein